MSYAEAIVTAASDVSEADRAKIQTWAEREEFQAIPMKMGMLITGDEELFRKVFGITQADLSARSTRDVSLPIPAEVASAVSSITIRRLPSIDG